MANILLRSIAEVDAVQQDEGTPPSSPEGNSSDASPQAVVRVKRAQVSAACTACRLRKAKCDALRPCTPCSKRQVNCQYETQVGETRQRASKRKFQEVARLQEAYEELYGMLQQRSERDVAEILRHIRSGQSPEAIVRFMKHVAVSCPRRLALEVFLISLAHCTGSLLDVIRFAISVLDPHSRIQLPHARDFLVFRNRIVEIPHLESLIRRAQPSGHTRPALPSPGGSYPPDADAQTRQGEISGDRPADPDTQNEFNKGAHGDIPHQVPAAPWTTITTSDEAVSHLVSLFLAWINPTNRFVEEDLFLFGMRSQQPNSHFCSPLLVNSICAIASLHSENEVAFPQRDAERITRGRHFHDEALRLWLLEDSRPTLTNVQALCILSLESSYRAKDRLGLTLIPIAARLNDAIPLYDGWRDTALGVSGRDFARARLSAYWMVRCNHVMIRISLMSGDMAEPSVTGLPTILDTFDDTVAFWKGYPLTTDAVLDRPTLYFQERCRLAMLLEEMHMLLLASTKQSDMSFEGFADAVHLLSAKMEHWHQHLPFELHYAWPMSVATWELHACYLSLHMTLFLMARSRYQQSQTPWTEPDGEDASLKTLIAQDMLHKAISLTHEAAQILRDFRERYGLKILPAWLLQLQAVAAGVLVLDPQLAHATSNTPTATDGGRSIQSSRAAFDEVFRCLLGTSVEILIARGIARMMYHTALERRVALSGPTRSLLQVMSDTAWRPSDLSLLSDSSFPNFATLNGHKDHERITELLSRWERLQI